MVKMILAAAAAFVLVNASPAFACPDCKDCPNKVAAAEKTEKKDAPACACGNAKECKCGEKCQCAHCGAKHGEKKGDEKKT